MGIFLVLHQSQVPRWMGEKRFDQMKIGLIFENVQGFLVQVHE